VRFRLWGPARARIDLVLEGEDQPRPMAALADGWHQVIVAEAKAGALYRFRLPDGFLVPDPASRFQPLGVIGPSEVIDPLAYAWRDAAWKGRAWHEAVIYELHVGAFTPAGTFGAVIDRLEHLQALGVTALQIMPIAAFCGGRNWGYDGVLPYAPASSYGRPEDFKTLIEAAHVRGMMVMLDVVYNHFGPSGNFLGRYAPQFFTDRHKTPWGSAINYDGAASQPVRDFMIENALTWLLEYNLDGLRLDAVHAIIDDSPRHLLTELADRVHAAVSRPVHLVLENEENQASRLQRSGSITPSCYTAQWNDDVHHVLHVAATGEGNGYYQAYVGDTQKLGRALAEGFAFQGEMMEYRRTPRGEPSANLPPTAFVAFIQNHDQVGNRAFGERIGAIAPPEAVRALAAVYLLLPQVPMLFMGEEWAASSPFLYFCDFDGDLAEAVRNGRRAEFAKFPEFADAALRARIPDPVAAETFQSAKLDWSEPHQVGHSTTLDWYQRILAVRRREIVPLLPDIDGHAGHYEITGEGAVTVTWQANDGRRLTLAANLSPTPVTQAREPPGRIVWQEGDCRSSGLGPWTVRWSIA
jgi:malto-oligosyltrehalose trehalohydrolase